MELFILHEARVLGSNAQIFKHENFKHSYPYEQFRMHKDDRKKVKKT